MSGGRFKGGLVRDEVLSAWGPHRCWARLDSSGGERQKHSEESGITNFSLGEDLARETFYPRRLGVCRHGTQASSGVSEVDTSLPRTCHL